MLGEEVKNKTFIDKLNRLEELELLNKNQWLRLRKDRNEIAYEHLFNQDEVVESISIIFASVDNMIKIYDDIYDYCLKKFDFIKHSDVLK